MPKTIIQHVGNPWEHRPDDYSKIAYLLELLDKYALDRSFEQFGNFVNPRPIACTPVNIVFRAFEAGRLPEYMATDPNPWEGLTHFWGNFAHYSASFSLYTNDPDLITTLTAAIEKNKSRPDYLSQTKPPAPAPCIMHFRDGHQERLHE